MSLFNSIQKETYYGTSKYDRTSKYYLQVNLLKETRFSDEVYKECIVQHEYVIKYIPFTKLSRKLSEELRILYFSETEPNRYLPNIPEQYRTKKVCLAALKNNGANLFWVFPGKIDAEMALIAMIHTYEYEWQQTLEHIPEKFKTDQFYVKSVMGQLNLIKLFDLKNVGSGMIF